MTQPEHHVAHPTPRQYVNIAILLAVLTGIEVALFYVEEALRESGGPVWFVIPALLILAFLKFVIVVGYYMHLRYEKSMLARFFSAGFSLALLLYGVVLAAFGVLVLAT